MPPTVSQEITEKLAQRIVDRQYNEGSKLPTERDLAIEFGVTRHVVREALKRLEALGLVRIRQGSGIYVEPMQLTGGIHILEMLLTRSSNLLSLPFLHDVIEFRGHIVGSMVRLAAQRRTLEELAAMRQAIEDRAAARDDMDRLEEANLRFYQLIAKATHNQVYLVVFNTMGGVFAKLRSLIESPLVGFESTHRMVQRMYEAFEQGDGDMAELLVKRYLDSLQQALGERAANN